VSSYHVAGVRGGLSSEKGEAGDAAEKGRKAIILDFLRSGRRQKHHKGGPRFRKGKAAEGRGAGDIKY